MARVAGDPPPALGWPARGVLSLPALTLCVRAIRRSGRPAGALPPGVFRPSRRCASRCGSGREGLRYGGRERSAALRRGQLVAHLLSEAAWCLSSVGLTLIRRWRNRVRWPNQPNSGFKRTDTARPRRRPSGECCPRQAPEAWAGATAARPWDAVQFSRIPPVSLRYCWPAGRRPVGYGRRRGAWRSAQRHRRSPHGRRSGLAA